MHAVRTPSILHPNFYTDIWVLPFALAGTYLYMAYIHKGGLWRAILCGVLLAMAASLKITAAIILIALVITELVKKTSGHKQGKNYFTDGWRLFHIHIAVYMVIPLFFLV